MKGVVSLANGLRKVKTKYPLVIAILPDVTENHREILVSQGCIVRKIKPVYPPENTTKKIAINDGQSLSQQHKKPSQISIVDGKSPSTAVGKSLVGNTILPTRPLLTLIFDSITPS